MRYIVFAGPTGGTYSYHGRFNTMQAVVTDIGSCDWCIVYDTQTDKIYDQTDTHATNTKSSEDIVAWAAEIDQQATFTPVHRFADLPP